MGLKDAKREKPAQEEAIRDTGNIETAQAVENKKHQKKSKSASDLAQWQDAKHPGNAALLSIYRWGIAGGNADAAVYQTVLPAY